MGSDEEYTVLHRRQIASTTDQLIGVRQVVEIEALRLGFDQETAFRLSLAVDEACTNIIKHSYDDNPAQKFELTLATQEDRFVIVLTDHGRSYNPTQRSPVDMEQYLRQMRHGGLGVHIIKLVMDDIQYVSDGNVANELHLIKRLPVTGREPTEHW